WRRSPSWTPRPANSSSPEHSRCPVTSSRGADAGRVVARPGIRSRALHSVLQHPLVRAVVGATIGRREVVEYVDPQVREPVELVVAQPHVAGLEAEVVGGHDPPVGLVGGSLPATVAFGGVALTPWPGGMVD